MSYVTLECNNCNIPHKIAGDDFAYEVVDSHERQMGAETTSEASIEVECKCGQSIEVTHRFWEYPEGVENNKETEVSGGKIVEDLL